jgi:hypothetical protein
MRGDAGILPILSILQSAQRHFSPVDRSDIQFTQLVSRLGTAYFAVLGQLRLREIFVPLVGPGSHAARVDVGVVVTLSMRPDPRACSTRRGPAFGAPAAFY